VVISRTPYRISLLGGSSDYPTWLKNHSGMVISTTIDKHLYVSVRKYPQLFGVKYRIVWSHVENATSCEEILHPVVRAALPFCGIQDGVEIHYQGDLPSKSGMGSSSSFTVGLLNALHTYSGKQLGKEELAREAMWLEQDILKENVGCQDQVAAAYGGMNVIQFHNSGFEVEKFNIDSDELQRWLMLFYLGMGRMSSTITKELVENIPYREFEINSIIQQAIEGRKFLENGEWEEFGILLDEMWTCKKRLAKRVSNPDIDRLYASAIAKGALGGKLLGAGGTGFFLLCVPPERQDAVKLALSHLTLVPFKFEGEGSKILLEE